MVQTTLSESHDVLLGEGLRYDIPKGLLVSEAHKYISLYCHKEQRVAKYGDSKVSTILGGCTQVLKDAAPSTTSLQFQGKWIKARSDHIV